MAKDIKKYIACISINTPLILLLSLLYYYQRYHFFKHSPPTLKHFLNWAFYKKQTRKAKFRMGDSSNKFNNARSNVLPFLIFNTVLLLNLYFLRCFNRFRKKTAHLMFSIVKLYLYLFLGIYYL